MHWITELNIPMDPSIIEMHNLHNGRLPCSTNTIKFWEYLLRVKSPHHTSSQNFTLVPSPTSYYRSLEKFNQFLVMNFYKLTPYTPDTNFVHQPPIHSHILPLQPSSKKHLSPCHISTIICLTRHN